MFAIPMDQKASALELKQGISVPISAWIADSSDGIDVIHPLQIRKNRILAYSYIAGRIVITADKTPDEHLVFITGIWPKYGGPEWARLQAAIGAGIYIIDVLPKLSKEEKQSMRRTFIDVRNLMAISNILSQATIGKLDIDRILKLSEGISEGATHVVQPLKTFIETINFEKEESLTSDSFHK